MSIFISFVDECQMLGLIARVYIVDSTNLKNYQLGDNENTHYFEGVKSSLPNLQYESKGAYKTKIQSA